MAAAICPPLSTAELAFITEALAFYRRSKVRQIEKSIRAAAFLLHGESSSSSHLEALEQLNVHPKVMELMDQLDELKHLEERLSNAAEKQAA